jgi:hypothetical protein
MRTGVPYLPLCRRCHGFYFGHVSLGVKVVSDTCDMFGFGVKMETKNCSGLKRIETANM